MWADNKSLRNINIAMLELLEVEGLTPEEIKSKVLEVLDDTMPELVELHIRREDKRQEECEICNTKLIESNVAKRHDGSIRLDSLGHVWCVTCTNKHDEIDWDDEAERSAGQ